nr:MAG TPA: hypothetical protein [Caudoviricetes sp.]
MSYFTRLCRVVQSEHLFNGGYYSPILYGGNCYGNNYGCN